MAFGYIKFLAEIQAEGPVRDVVVTIPSWFTYDQRLMIEDAADLSGLRVLQMTHENTAASTMFSIDHKVAEGETKTVLFYNMGAMDTEVMISRFSLFN